jgi:hypothetical protein
MIIGLSQIVYAIVTHSSYSIGLRLVTERRVQFRKYNIVLIVLFMQRYFFHKLHTFTLTVLTLNCRLYLYESPSLIKYVLQ